MPLASSSARGGSAERTGARRDVEQRSPPSGARPDLAPNDLYSVCGLREQVDVEPTTPPRARPSDRGRARPVTMTTGSAESEPAALAPVGVRQAESVPRRQRRGRRRDGRRRASMSVRHRKEIRDHLGRSPELGSATRSPPYKPASHASTKGLADKRVPRFHAWTVLGGKCAHSQVGCPHSCQSGRTGQSDLRRPPSTQWPSSANCYSRRNDARSARSGRAVVERLAFALELDCLPVPREALIEPRDSASRGSGGRCWGQVRGFSGRLRALQGRVRQREEPAKLQGERGGTRLLRYSPILHGKEGVGGSSPSEGSGGSRMVAGVAGLRVAGRGAGCPVMETIWKQGLRTTPP